MQRAGRTRNAQEEREEGRSKQQHLVWNFPSSPPLILRAPPLGRLSVVPHGRVHTEHHAFRQTHPSRPQSIIESGLVLTPSVYLSRQLSEEKSSHRNSLVSVFFFSFFRDPSDSGRWVISTAVLPQHRDHPRSQTHCSAVHLYHHHQSTTRLVTFYRCLHHYQLQPPLLPPSSLTTRPRLSFFLSARPSAYDFPGVGVLSHIIPDFQTPLVALDNTSPPTDNQPAI